MTEFQLRTQWDKNIFVRRSSETPEVGDFAIAGKEEEAEVYHRWSET